MVWQSRVFSRRLETVEPASVKHKKIQYCEQLKELKSHLFQLAYDVQLWFLIGGGCYWQLFKVRSFCFEPLIHFLQ